MPHQITIRFFAHLKDLAGMESVSLPFEQDCPLKQLIAQLEETIPALKSRGGIQMAVNHAFVNDEAIIHPGDEIAFLPPFSGG
ncbi:MAG: molybdopterin converting factor subunit 1 [Nitrospirae bacterium]|nr:molybdopterin converting factor subunit 1 [Candidatus Troglogloeales bacterium]